MCKTLLGPLTFYREKKFWIKIQCVAGSAVIANKCDVGSYDSPFVESCKPHICSLFFDTFQLQLTYFMRISIYLEFECFIEIFRAFFGFF